MGQNAGFFFLKKGQKPIFSIFKSQILQLTFKQCCFGIYFSKEYYSTKKARESYTKLRKDQDSDWEKVQTIL